MKKRIIILICFALSFITLNAQQDGQFALFPWSSLYYNPGTAGEQNNTLCFTGIFANHNTGFRDNASLDAQSQNGTGTESPDQNEFAGTQDFLMNAEFYSRKIRGAFGLSLLSDQIDAQNNVIVRLGYTYRMKIAAGSLGIGFQASLFNQTYKPKEYRPGQEGDGTVDGLRADAGVSTMNLDFNLGVHYKAETWDAGVSVVNLLGKKTPIVLSGGEKLHLPRELYIHGGYIWTIPANPNWTLEPKALIKTDFASFQIDAMILTRYNGIIWGGLSYRIDDAVSILLGARPFFNSSNNYIKGLDVGFAYGIDTKKFAYKSNGGSIGHFEVILRYCFDIYKTETFFGYGSSRGIYKNQY
jgi:type IX secretion system PorP/SprF family membrane protein